MRNRGHSLRSPSADRVGPAGSTVIRPGLGARGYARGGGTSGAAPGPWTMAAGCKITPRGRPGGGSSARMVGRPQKEAQDNIVMHAAPCESAERSARMPGMPIDSCVIVGPSPFIGSVHDAQSNAPAAVMLVCSMRSATKTRAILRTSGIQSIDRPERVIPAGLAVPVC